MRLNAGRTLSLMLCVAGTAQIAVAQALVGGPLGTSESGGFAYPRVVTVTNTGLALGGGVRFNEPGFPFVWNAAGSVLLAHPDENGSYNLGYDAVAIGGTSAIFGSARGYDGSRFQARAVRWASPAARPVALPATSDGALATNAFSSVTAANASGLAVGRAQTFDADGNELGIRSVRWPANGTTPVVLRDADGFDDPFTSVMAVNAGGTIIGGSANGSGPATAFRWSPNATNATHLGDLGTRDDGYRYAAVAALNDAGIVVGVSEKFDALTHRDLGNRPVRWSPGQTWATELDVPTSATFNGYTNAAAFAVNAGGTAIGDYEIRGAQGQYVGRGLARWPAGGHAVVALAANTGFANRRVNALNATGTIVGQTERTIIDGATSFDETRAVFWLASGTVAVDLNVRLPAASGWILEDAQAISDTGFISGVGRFDPDGVGPIAPLVRTFTLLVPEAGSYGRGDADFDTDTDFDDLLLLARRYGKPSNGSIDVADFELDGDTDFDDLLTLARHYGNRPAAATLAASTSEAFAAEFALAQALVPEPTTALAAITSLAGWAVAGRQRRRRARASRR